MTWIAIFTMVLGAVLGLVAAAAGAPSGARLAGDELGHSARHPLRVRGMTAPMRYEMVLGLSRHGLKLMRGVDCVVAAIVNHRPESCGKGGPSEGDRDTTPIVVDEVPGLNELHSFCT